MSSKTVAKTIEYGLYLLAFVLPIQIRWIIKPGQLNSGYWEYGTISLYFSDILILSLLLLLVIIISKPALNNYLTAKKIWWLIAGLELIIFISIFFAENKLLSLFYYGRFLTGLGLFYLVIKSSYNRLTLIYSFLAGVALQAGLAIWQFLNQSGFASKWLGLASHQAGGLGSSVIESANGERWLRAYGGLDHPNILGGLMVIGILLVVGLMIRRKVKIEQPNGSIDLSVYTDWLLLLLFSAALLFSFSRAAWLGLLVGLLTILADAVMRKKLARQKTVLEIILVFGVLFFVLYNIFPSLISTRFSTAARLEEKSVNERLWSYQDAWQLIRRHLIIGAGIGNYTLALDKELRSDAPAYSYQPVHNTYLLITAETGIVGIVFFVSFLVYVGCLIFVKEDEADQLPADRAIFLAVLIMMMFDHWWWSLHFGVLLFWLSLAIILRDNRG